jgi:ATP synthase F1 epsilon subunit
MIHFQLVSLSGTKFEDDVYEVLVPVKDGTVGLFEQHMPLIGAASPGILSVRKKASDDNDKMENFAVCGGVVQVDGTNIRFLSDDITTSDEANEQEAAAALARAQELVKNADNQIAADEAKELVRYHEAHLDIAKLKKHHH